MFSLTGYMSGSQYNQRGSGSNYLCLPDKPQWRYRMDGMQQWAGRLYGVESQTYPNKPDRPAPFSTTNNGGRPYVNLPVPCAACYVPSRSASIMIPARTECPAGWTLEYSGYLVSEDALNDRQGTSYECVDEAPEPGAGGTNKDQALFYAVQVGCGTLPCSVYTDGWEITCVVCTK
jgi:hypothetical protein